MTTTDAVREPAPARSAHWVAAGILLSRITGLIRVRVFAHYFGTSLFADVFTAALRMPNILQNLLGEGVLSASFIPVYAELLEDKREEEAGRVAGAVFALLLALAGGLALVGILFAPLLVTVFLPGFEGLRRELAIKTARIIFPMTGTLVLSAWALGILNSHRRFFLSYVAPVLWNAAMIATLVVLGGQLDPSGLVIALAWGAFVGGLLQFAFQLPWVFRLTRGLKVRWDTRLAGVREAVKNAGPAILGRGVVQLSGWVDLVLASLLSISAVSALGYAQTLYLLPVSLFGMSVAAAELPELSRQRRAASETLRLRINAGLRQIAFYAVPSAVGYLVLGDVIVACLYQTGDFGPDDTLLAYLVLAGYTLGLVASTGTRLFSSAFFALHDTRTPAKVALLRVLVAGALGFVLMLQLEPVILAGHPLGPVGLSAAAGLAAWLEWAVLRRSLWRRLGPVGPGARPLARMLLAAAIAAAAARALLILLPPMGPIAHGALVLPTYAVAYFGLAELFGIADLRRLLRQLLRRPGA